MNGNYNSWPKRLEPHSLYARHVHENCIQFTPPLLVKHQGVSGLRVSGEIRRRAKREGGKYSERRELTFIFLLPVPLHLPPLSSSKNGPPSTTKDGTVFSPVNPKEGLILRLMRRHTVPSLF